jgi:asparagine synthase (glutamine-hydrolysing)
MDPELAREGLRRLKPLRRLAASLVPDPVSDVGRICLRESAHYMRNQLLRDADCAGMAHGVEIRVPLVDVTLLEALAASLPGLMPGAGEAALATAPSAPLPDEIANRAKTGFVVPTRDWLRASSGRSARSEINTRGIDSRDWSRVIFGKLSAEHATA